MTNNHVSNHTDFNCAELRFDLELGVVRNAFGDSQRLSPINLKLLRYLVSRQGDLVSRTELFDAIWPNQIVSDDVLTRAVSDLRTQLAKLNGSTKFIDTLPKRGYRWVVDVTPLNTNTDNTKTTAGLIDVPVSPLLDRVDLPAPVFTSVARKLTHVFLYIVAALLLAFAIMWFIGQSSANQMSIAVLSTGYDRPQISATAKMVNDNVLHLLRKNSHVKLISKSAIASRPHNPFPYFFTEFGATWVIESRVSDLEGVNYVELSLVDARTGLELRTISFDATSNTELLTMLSRKLEADLLADVFGY